MLTDFFLAICRLPATNTQFTVYGWARFVAVYFSSFLDIPDGTIVYERHCNVLPTLSAMAGCFTRTANCSTVHVCFCNRHYCNPAVTWRATMSLSYVMPIVLAWLVNGRLLSDHYPHPH